MAAFSAKVESKQTTIVLASNVLPSPGNQGSGRPSWPKPSLGYGFGQAKVHGEPGVVPGWGIRVAVAHAVSCMPGTSP
ncbi:hypothetical protein AOZ07_16210 [Glutamicibacter halophytocola]|nr:hypothetical protein AOZ07_16210 [Glutamicibacter halophytocola]